MKKYLVVQLVAAAAAAYAARKRGRNWMVWGLACFLFPPVFVVLLVLPRALAPGATVRCPECGKVILRGSAVCEYCKRELPIEMVACPRCGKYVSERGGCPGCGA